MPRFVNPNVNNFMGANNAMVNPNNQMFGGNNAMVNAPMQANTGYGSCQNTNPKCPTVYKQNPPIVTCSKQVLDQYHITKQPYIHNYHTEVVHHHITQNEFIPQYTCSQVNVNGNNNQLPPLL